MKSTEEKLTALISSYAKLEKLLQQPMNERKHEEFYPFIPFCSYSFVECLKLIEHNSNNKLPKTFIDFGCGIGTKLVIANSLFNFDSCIGYEYDLDLVDKSSMLYDSWSRNSKINIINKDITRITKQDLGKSPIIAYYYCPIKDITIERKFEKSLEDKLPKESYLIACLKQEYSTVKDKRFKRLGYISSAAIFKKISN